MPQKKEKSCAACAVVACERNSKEQFPEFCPTAALDQELLERSLEVYENEAEIKSLAHTAAAIESEFYCRLTRVEETLELISRRAYQLVGVATCTGLINEARIFCSLLKDRDYKTHRRGL